MRRIMNDKPILYMSIGIPGSGKSTHSEITADKHTRPLAIHSSDKLREELYGDVNCQEKNADIFAVLHKRIKQDLSNGIDVYYDACNINKKRRTAFLSELKNIECKKVAIVFATPYDVCLERNSKRDRKVPEDVIRRMYMNWNPPDYSEGFDDIEIVYDYGDMVNRMKYSLQYLFAGIDDFSQDNSHHTLTLGEHCRSAAKYIRENTNGGFLLQMAALLHDNGKVFTKTSINSRGEKDGDCHYYQHQCVGAYDAMFYSDVVGLHYTETVQIINLIYYHMHPYISWKQSEKALNKDRKIIGEAMFNNILLLHEADLAAH